MSYLALPLRLLIGPYTGPGVYLRWLTGLSTWDGFFFPGAIDDKTDTADASELSTTDGRATVAIRRPATLTVRAGDLSTAQHEALSTLLDSPQVYRQFADGTRQPVLPDTSLTRTTADGRHELELEQFRS